MAFPEVTVCSSWATAADVCGPCADYGVDLGLLEDKLLIASEILYYLSGSRWPGECVDTVRPCSEYSTVVPVGAWQSWSGQAVSASGVAQWGYCGCHADNSCGCGALSVIKLPHRPVTGIVNVKIDGLVLDPTFYRVDDWHRLTYLPGAGDTRQGWPCCQRLDLPATDEGTFEVTYSYGTPPSPAGVAMAAAFGCEMYLAAKGSSKCRLPQRLTNITRQGVTMSFLSDLSALRTGWTELPEVDQWLGSLRHAHATRPAVVVNPDRWGAGVRRITG